MNKRGGFLGLGIVLGVLVVGLTFASYDYVTQQKSPRTTLALKDSSSNQLTAQMRDDIVRAVEDIDLRLKALEGGIPTPSPTPTPVNGQCGTAAGACKVGSAIADNNATCGTRTWTCLGSNNGTPASCVKELAPCAQPRKNCTVGSTFTYPNLYPNTTFKLEGRGLQDGESQELVAKPTKLELPDLSIEGLTVANLGTKPEYHVRVSCNDGKLVFSQNLNTKCPQGSTYAQELHSCGSSCPYSYPKYRFISTADRFPGDDRGEGRRTPSDCLARTDCPYPDRGYLCQRGEEFQTFAHGRGIDRGLPEQQLCPSRRSGPVDYETQFHKLCVNGTVRDWDGKM